MVQIIIPCDYHPNDGMRCKNGKVLIYGDFPVPSELITCPKCKGEGIIKIGRQEILNQISDLLDERKEIDKEIETLKGYLEK